VAQCPELKFFGKQAHRDQGKNQDECEPEEDRIEECFLDCVLHLTLVHEETWKVKIDPLTMRKKISTTYATGNGNSAHSRESRCKTYASVVSVLTFDLKPRREREFNEYVLERRSTLS